MPKHLLQDIQRRKQGWPGVIGSSFQCSGQDQISEEQAGVVEPAQRLLERS